MPGRGAAGTQSCLQVGDRRAAGLSPQTAGLARSRHRAHTTGARALVTATRLTPRQGAGQAGALHLRDLGPR